MRYAALILILLARLASAEDLANNNSYLCIADEAVGFAFNETSKSWDQTTFSVSNDKYIVRPIKPDDMDFFGEPLIGAYGVWAIGNKDPLVLCDAGISEHSWLRCGGEYRIRFTLNARGNRYMLSSDGSYMVATFASARNTDGSYKTDENGDSITVDKEDEGGDAAFMEIGKCSKL